MVVVCDRLETIAKPLDHLRRQTIAERLELVVVAPREAGLSPEQIGAFAAVTVVPVERLVSLARARADGVRAARAPLVAFVESHTFPVPGWAQALVAAQRGPWEAVGPAMTNANPDRALSWANLLLDYGPWLEPERGREMDDLPGHNSCYRRERLLELEPDLARLLEAESVLHAQLRRRGGRLWLEPAAQIAHLNVTRPGSWATERLAAGRRFAASRAHRWPPARRAAYAAGSPLIPLVRLVRIAPVWRRCRARRRLPALTLPAVAVSLTISAAGELIGYLNGSGDSIERLSWMELHKERHLAGAEQRRPVAPT